MDYKTLFQNWLTMTLAFVAGGLIVLGLGGIKSNEDFKVTRSQMINDVQTRFVAIQPQGQLWAFSPDQKVDVDVLQVKSSEEGVIVSARLTALANVNPAATSNAPKVEAAAPAPGKGTSVPQSTPNPMPVTVELKGIAKLHYEWIAGEWHLAEITSVNLQATQK